MAQRAAFIRSAHVIVSAETRAARQPLVTALEAALAPVLLSGRLEQVDDHDPAELVRGPTPIGSLVDMAAANLDDEALRPHVRVLHIRQLSNALKHLEALKRIAALPELVPEAGAGARFGLVVEDDAVFGDGMADALWHAAVDAPADADVVFVGLPSTRMPPPGATASLFDDPLRLFPGNVLPACDSYLVTPAGARRLAQAFMPVRLATHVQLSYLLRKGAAKAYVAVPNVFVDGSKVGVATSSIETNNQLVWNQVYCQASELLRTGRADVKQLRRDFDEVWKNQAFKEHPDCLVQLADQLAAVGRHGEAQDAYEKALAGYTAQNCIVNTSSEFMKRYMATYGKA